MSHMNKKLVLKINKKLDKIYHPDTGLVFKSAKDRVIVGRIVNNKYVELDSSSMDLADEWNFTIDPSLVDEGSASEEESGSESESEEDDSDKPDTKESPVDVVEKKVTDALSVGDDGDDVEDTEDESDEEPVKVDVVLVETVSVEVAPVEEEMPTREFKIDYLIGEAFDHVRSDIVKAINVLYSTATPITTPIAVDPALGERIAELEAALATEQVAHAKTKKKTKMLLAQLSDAL